ncbi:MAG: pectate lyase [Phycisphaerae bacterium]
MSIRMSAFAILWCAAAAFGQTATSAPASAPTSKPAKTRDMSRFSGDGWAKMPPEWFRSDEAAEFAENVLSWQLPDGGWPKNIRGMQLRDKDIETSPDSGRSSFDNSATIPQLRFMGHIAQATGKQQYKDSFFKGLDLVLAAQMPCGGWPQVYPDPRGYQRLITYNDGAMINIMMFLREVAAGKFAFVDAGRVAKAKTAIDRGLECILKTQVVVNGRLTVWGQQHDPDTFAPAKARAFELPYLTAAESTGVVNYLMDLDNPSPQVRQAVHAAIAWMKQSQLNGIRTVRQNRDVVVVQDPNAEPLWARFYDQATGKPVFVGRDSQPKSTLAEIERERRGGYAWYGRWPTEAFNHYEKWCAKYGEQAVK